MTLICTQPGCGGTIDADGYCDTCGLRQQVSASTPGGGTNGAAGTQPTTPAPAPAERALVAPVGPGSACPQLNCGGTIAEDGYCDTCGMRAVPATPVPAAAGSGGAPGSTGGLGTGGHRPSIAAPTPPDVSARVTAAGTSMAPSRRTLTSAGTTNRSGIGRGLVQVAPTPVGDPAQAVMSEAKIASVLGEVPEEDRHCTSCGSPVGQSIDGQPGRVKGFCGNCRHPFDFVTNEPGLRAGELVAGQYEILGPLAHGGMGWIYLGRDKAVSDRWVVLKGLLNESDPDAIIAAVAERQFLARIEHANIVNIYNFVTHRGSGYIVMEMVGGESLNSKLKGRREANGGVPDPLPPAEAIAYVLGILPAFGYLHGLGLVYNDLKPANIMAVAADVKLIDVGAVMQIDDHQAAIFGTQGFQAPEVASEGPSVASDLFTVGRTLAVLMLRFVFHDGPYLYTLPDRVDEPLFAQWESLHRFLLRACAHHRDDRFQSAAEMAEQLTGVLREMVAVSEDRPRAYSSTVFEGDRLPGLLVASAEEYDVTAPDHRVLPPARVAADDPAAPFLAELDELDAYRAHQVLERAIADDRYPDSIEVALYQARLQVELGDDPSAVLAEVEEQNPWEWRVPWYRGLHRLSSASAGHADRAAEAAELFSRVWTELPGETAPKLAVALAAEMAGQYPRAEELYRLVMGADVGYVSAAFGLARCERHDRDVPGAVDALSQVPASSAAHYDAQVAMARTLVAGTESGGPSMEQLAAASTTIERLQLDASERAALSAEVYNRALAGLTAGTFQPQGQVVLGRQLNEGSLREGLEETYRLMARLTDDPDERIRLVDRANAVRPRTLL
ncbi:MAG: tetratricopeptide repeat protein [Actinomycetota bacterium]